MTHAIVKQAARDNALWCDAVCAAHHGAGELQQDLWLTRHGAPRYYPDAVTLAGAGAAPLQTEVIARLAASRPGRPLAVKDSFKTLDLHGLGFAPLFDAEWIALLSPPPPARDDTARPDWRQVAEADGLARWERAWGGDGPEARAETRLFPPGLLAHPHVRFVATLEGDAVRGGGVLTTGAGVVGLSNLFARGIDVETVWRGFVGYAATPFPGLIPVAWDRGEDLAAAHRAGFTTIGTLRVWHRPG